MSHLQTLNKTILLGPNWRDDNYAGYSKYIGELYNTEKILASLFTSDEVEIVSIKTSISIDIKEKDKPTDNKDHKDSLGLTDSFWVDVASGKYSG